MFVPTRFKIIGIQDFIFKFALKKLTFLKKVSIIYCIFNRQWNQRYNFIAIITHMISFRYV